LGTRKVQSAWQPPQAGPAVGGDGFREMLDLNVVKNSPGMIPNGVQYEEETLADRSVGVSDGLRNTGCAMPWSWRAVKGIGRSGDHRGYLSEPHACRLLGRACVWEDVIALDLPLPAERFAPTRQAARWQTTWS
jgi:hypothetical protein